MTSQLNHNFQVSQAVRGADDISNTRFKRQINSISICGPQVDSHLLHKSGVPNLLLLTLL